MTALLASALAAAEMERLASSLCAAGLHSEDLAEPGCTFFRFDAETLVGYGGLEGDGADRLLRSVVILPNHRGQGVGRTLVEMLEHEARNIGVRRLHLLTTTAAPFFRSLGYVDAERSFAPPSVASSREFTSLCPASATYLVKAL